MDQGQLEGMLGEGMSLAAIGRELGRHESTVAYWVDKYRLAAGGADKNAARGGLRRQELEMLVVRGLSIAQIASEVDRSKGAVRYWLRRYGLKTWSASGSRRAAESQAARAAGVRESTMLCATHGETALSSMVAATTGVANAEPSRVATAAQDEADPGGGGWWSVLAVWLLQVDASAAFPPRQPGREAAGAQCERGCAVPCDAARRGAQVHSTVL